jgi:hypothetical protein
VPVGMGTVVPAKKIRELLQNDPDLEKARKEWINRHNQDRAAMQDSVLVARAPPM